MSTDLVNSATPEQRGVRKRRSGSEWRVLFAEFERCDGTQASFCETRGVALNTFHLWRGRLGLASGSASPGSVGFVQLSPPTVSGWDVELSLGDGVVLRLRRS